MTKDIDYTDLMTGQEIMDAYGMTADELVKLIKAGLPAHEGTTEQVELEPDHLVTQITAGNLIEPGKPDKDYTINNLIFVQHEFNGWMEGQGNAKHFERHVWYLKRLKDEVLTLFYSYPAGSNPDTPELREIHQRYYNLTGKNLLGLPVKTSPSVKKPKRKDTERNAKALEITEQLRKENPDITKAKIYANKKIKELYQKPDGSDGRPSDKHFRDKILKDF